MAFSARTDHNLFGIAIFGFSFKRTAGMVGDFITFLLQECINEGIALIGNLPAPSPPTEPPPEPILCDTAFRQNQDYLLRPTRVEGLQTDRKNPQSTFIFENTLSNQWYDPDPSMGYRFVARGDTLFTEIMNFPCLTDDRGNPIETQFNISVGNRNLGRFSTKEPINFSNFPLDDLLIADPTNGKRGIKEFTVTGYKRIAERYLLIPSPQLKFNKEIGDFEINLFEVKEEPVDVPEPTSIFSILLLSGLGWCLNLWRKPKS